MVAIKQQLADQARATLVLSTDIQLHFGGQTKDQIHRKVAGSSSSKPSLAGQNLVTEKPSIAIVILQIRTRLLLHLVDCPLWLLPP